MGKKNICQENVLNPNGHIAQFCLGKSVNLASIKDETNLNYIKGTPRKMGESLLNLRPKYNLIQDMFQQRAEITYD